MADDVNVEGTENKRCRQGDEEEDEGNTCQICYSVWTSHGAHQLCSLRCGHFFGLSCIQRVLRDQGKRARHCPLCNQPAKDSEVRLHFAITSFSAKDATKEETLTEQVGKERAARIEAEMSSARHKVRIEQLEQELKALKSTLQQRMPPHPPVVARSSSPLNSAGGDAGFIRPLAVAATTEATTISVPMLKGRAACWVSPERGSVVAMHVNEPSGKYKLVSVHPLFPGRTRVPSGGRGHTMPIRDISYKDSNGVCYGGALATASLDNTVHLISASNLNEVCTFDLQEPVWSVAFLRDNVLLAGTARGKLVTMDPRMPKIPVSCLFSASEPIHSICPLSSTAVAIASFTKVYAVQMDGSNGLATAHPLSGLTPRAMGDQYSSMVASARDSNLAISVRSQSRSYVEVGAVDPAQASFHRVAEYSSMHQRPSGRIACLDAQNVLVPDEASKRCAIYSSNHEIGDGKQPISGAWYCGDEDLCMFLSQDTVQFYEL